jgi:hypothetical protein
MHATTRIALARLALVAFLPTPATAQWPDLTGHWTYNAAQSNDPRDMMRSDDSTGGERRGGFGGDGGGGGRRGGGFGGGGGMSDEQRARMHETMQLVFHAPPELTIAETDSTLRLAGDTGAALLLYADGRRLKQTVDGGGDIEIKGHWRCS